MGRKKKEEVFEEVFNEYDEPEITEDDELVMYGPKPEGNEGPIIPQSHGEEESYETGDENI